MNKIHIAKRDTLPLYINIAIRGGAIILALLVCALVTTVLTGENPLSIYGTILKGAFGLNRSFADILTGIILFFIIGCEFFINYKVQFRTSGKKEA